VCAMRKAETTDALPPASAEERWSSLGAFVESSHADRRLRSDGRGR
jgi:hypothetical protein